MFFTRANAASKVSVAALLAFVGATMRLTELVLRIRDASISDDSQKKS
jgi:hypothetical protein